MISSKKIYGRTISITRDYTSLLLCLLFVIAGNAQTTTVLGKVTDAETGEPLIAAAVNFAGTTSGTNTDFDGNYELVSATASDTIIVTYLGYENYRYAIKQGQSQTVNVKLIENAVTLGEAVVTYKEKYRNKDNPAVQLIKKVIAEKDNNRASNYDFYEYEKYEKVMLGLSNVSKKFKSRKAFKTVQFLFEELDTTSLGEGQELLPIYLNESLSDVRYRKSPSADKEIIIADTMVTFDGFADTDGFNHYLDNLYQSVNIYDNNILLIKQQFLSPIANTAPASYKFFIQDTLIVDGVNCIELFFAPKNNLDVLFQGSMYIAFEDNYNVKQVIMSVNSNIGLNWVKSLKLSQTFEKKEGFGFIQTRDEFAADFGVTSKGMGMYGSRTVTNEKIVINQARPDEDYKGLDVEKAITEGNKTDEFWEENRHEKLSESEALTYQKIDSLQNVKIFKQVMTIATIALSGYTNITPYFEIGPVNAFYSFGNLEGFRLRLGGRTTPKFSDRTEIETYAAYGFGDEQWKGYIGLSQALSKGNLQQFPVRRLRASAQRETAIPGQELQFVQEDNLLLSFKRGVNNKFLYNDIYRLEYFTEFDNHFSFSVGLKNWTQTPAADLIYPITGSPDAAPEFFSQIQTSEINTLLRWAPKEQFYQGKTYRKRIYNRYPIFVLRHNMGVKGMLGGEYNYHNLSLNIFKRFYLSRLGNSDVYLQGGVILGQAPYPLLNVHAANQTYSFQLQGFNMMNFLEFVSDRYVVLNIDHDFRGFFLNKIPLIRKLKLKEAFNLRVLYGGISDRNNPNKNDGLVAFPVDENGNTTTFSLEEKPYIEGSIGIGNIFKFFRVDLVKRLNYLDNPNVTDLGIRARFKIYF
jgi:hypothetical protein